MTTILELSQAFLENSCYIIYRSTIKYRFLSHISRLLQFSQFQFSIMLSHDVSEIELVVSVYFFLDFGKHFSKEHLRTRKPNTRNAKILQPVSNTSRRGARAAYRDEYSRDFGPPIAYRPISEVTSRHVISRSGGQASKQIVCVRGQS